MNWFKKKKSAFELRKEEITRNLSLRQKLFHRGLRGASWTEVVLVLEARIHTLEQEMMSMKKIPTLVDVVLPDVKPVTKTELVDEALVVESIREPVKPKTPRKPKGPKGPKNVVDSIVDAVPEFWPYPYPKYVPGDKVK